MTAPSADVEERVSALLRLDYPVSVRRRAGEVILEIEALRVVGRGPSLETAESDLTRAKHELFRAYVDAGLEAQIPLPLSESRARDVLVRSAPLMLAVVTGVTLLAIVGVLVTGPVVTAIRSRLSPEVLAIRAGSVLGEISTRLEGLSEERRERIRVDLDRLVRNVRPFVRTFRPLVEDLQKDSDPGTASPP